MKMKGDVSVFSAALIALAEPQRARSSLIHHIVVSGSGVS